MDRAPDIAVELHIRRPPHEVRAWWLEMPEDYVAADPREQPFRIKTLRRTQSEWEIMTYWRVLGRVTKVPETFHLKPDGDWDVDIALPFGLRQRDAFVLHPTREGTRVEIRAWVHAPTAAAKAMRPLFLALYARRAYPATWRTAAELCERDAPVLPIA